MHQQKCRLLPEQRRSGLDCTESQEAPRLKASAPQKSLSSRRRVCSALAALTPSLRARRCAAVRVASIRHLLRGMSLSSPASHNPIDVFVCLQQQKEEQQQ